ncbi:hypothetical protein AGOR_G00155790 [Albula goreensis]|uniref:Uncharacterized protein n=1 Tax=Albula goreensis TaxID=1534307 RepID=A0A8T3D7M1_9TELE|nr:hypothetical protein AGOR_G00155790 [Albula goreensis]
MDSQHKSSNDRLAMVSCLAPEGLFLPPGSFTPVHQCGPLQAQDNMHCVVWTMLCGIWISVQCMFHTFI